MVALTEMSSVQHKAPPQRKMVPTSRPPSERSTGKRVSDLFAAIFFAMIGSVVFWWGTWKLLSWIALKMTFLDPLLIGATILVAAAVLVKFFFASLWPFMNPTVSRFYIIKIVVIYICSCANLAQWWGSWTLLERLDFNHMGIPLGAGAACAILLSLIGIARTAGDAPLNIHVDAVPDAIEPVPYFGTKHKCFRLLDIAFSIIFVTTLCVITWRGAFVSLNSLIEQKWYVSAPVYSQIWDPVSTIIGLVLMIVLLLLEEPIRSRYEKFPKAIHLIARFVYIWLCILAMLSVWRGCWRMLDQFVSVSPILNGNANKELYYHIAAHGIGFLWMAVTLTASSICEMGISFDRGTWTNNYFDDVKMCCGKRSKKSSDESPIVDEEQKPLPTLSRSAFEYKQRSSVFNKFDTPGTHPPPPLQRQPPPPLQQPQPEMRQTVYIMSQPQGMYSPPTSQMRMPAQMYGSVPRRMRAQAAPTFFTRPPVPVNRPVYF